MMSDIRVRHRRFFFLLLVSLWSIFNQSGLARGEDLSKRHLTVLYTGVGKIHGNYYVVLQNSSDKPLKVRIPVLLPKETVDYQLGNGTNPEDVIPGNEQGLVVSKEIPVGMTMLSFAFIVNAEGSEVKLTFPNSDGIDGLTIVTPEDGLIVKSDKFAPTEAPPMGHGTKYLAFGLKEALTPGTPLEISIEGVAEGRSKLSVTGLVFILVTGLAAGYLAWQTRPTGLSSDRV